VPVRPPPEAAKRLGVRTVEARAREALPRRLVLPGTLGISQERVYNVTSPVTGEVIEVGPAKVGDAVKKGQLLAVVRSKALGEKKSELFEALVSLHLDEELLERLEKKSKDAPEILLLSARRNVETDRNAIARARRVLALWRVDPAHIKAVEAEAKRIAFAKGKGKPEKKKALDKSWARLEIRAPVGGTLVEKSVNVGEFLRDKASVLFKVADLRKLAVHASAPEEHLPALLALQARHRPRPVPWQVRLAGKERALLQSAGMVQIFPVVDSSNNPPTSRLTGEVESPDGALRPGQAVQVTIFLPSAAGEIAVPTLALVETGKASYVFVQAGSKKLVFTERRVVVVRRGRDMAHVRAPPAAGKKPGPLFRPGERVVTEGALELKAALDDLRGEGP
jgi:cobalt-zinc-cadmium efflux system membrane fusion protein